VSSNSSPPSSLSQKRGRLQRDDDNDGEIISDKRRRNNAAAAKYRQKKLDRISEAEKSLADVCGERDELKLQLARRDAEIEVLRRMLDEKK